MRILIYLISFLLLAILLISCLSLDIDTSGNSYFEEKEDCEFVQIDENEDGYIDDSERAIMNSCDDNSFETLAELEENLIGEWELVGYGNWWGWYKSNPCSYIVVEKDELLFQYSNEHIDTIITFKWHIDEHESFGTKKFELILEPEIWPRPTIRHFCLDYMYDDTTPFDGVMHLYHKVKHTGIIVL